MTALSISVPCQNEVGYIDSFLSPAFPQKLHLEGHTLEVVVADGMSDDGTREQLRDWQQRQPNLIVIEDPQRITSAGLNMAIERARGEIVVRMDVHTTYSEDYVTQRMQTLQTTGATCVGGPWKSVGHSPVQKAIAGAFESRLGFGGATSRRADYSGPSDTVCLGAWRRDDLVRLAGCRTSARGIIAAIETDGRNDDGVSPGRPGHGVSVAAVSAAVATAGASGPVYGQLIHDIAAHPLGIGKGRFVEANDFSWLREGVCPHHNLLGIGAELGIPALVLFVAFVLTAVTVLWRRALGDPAGHGRHLRMLATAVLAIFVYQQFRSLFQDTWVVRETYLWLGLSTGAVLTRLTRSSTAALTARAA